MSNMELLSAQKLLEINYSHLYGPRREPHDSPEQTRINLARRLMKVLQSQLVPHSTILNIGSGPQSFERQLSFYYSHKAHADLLNQFNFYTVDIADIPKKALLATKHVIPLHTRANAHSLPFPDKAMGVVLSNMAIDFIPRTDTQSPFSEVARVMDGESIALFNFHHPNLIPNNLESIHDGACKDYWTFLRDNNILFPNEASIIEHLSMHGLSVQSVYLENELSNTWWNVTAVKAA